MKLTFEPNLDYQQTTINAVTKLFEGQADDSFDEFILQEEGIFDFTNAISNRLMLSEEQILSNLQKVQLQNEIEQSETLDNNNISIEMKKRLFSNE